MLAGRFTPCLTRFRSCCRKSRRKDPRACRDHADAVASLPDVPTLAEAGYPEVDVVTWYALIAPAGTPRPILDRLYKEYTAVAQLPEVQKFLADQGLVYLPNTQDQFARRVEAESARWAQIVREQNIRLD